MWSGLVFNIIPPDHLGGEGRQLSHWDSDDKALGEKLYS